MDPKARATIVDLNGGLYLDKDLVAAAGLRAGETVIVAVVDGKITLGGPARIPRPPVVGPV